MPKMEFSVCSLVRLIGTWLALFSVQAFAEQCPAIYTNAIQTHGSEGWVEFDLKSRVEQAPSAIVNTGKVQGWGRKRACNGALCVANGQNTEALLLPGFPVFESSRELSIPAWGQAVAGAGPDDEFRRISLRTSAKLQFSPARTRYRIKTLDAAYGADIELAPGDYWIDELSLGGANKITISGSGKARLFVNRDLRIPAFSEVNEDTEDSGRLSIVVNGKFEQGSSTKVYALIYARGEYEQDSFSVLGGMVNARQVDLKHTTQIRYQEAALQGAPLGMVCGPTGLEDLDGDGIPDHEDSDRDGDGISNTYEVATGTNPNDPADTPVDNNGNGIPDDLETLTLNNQCVAGFTNGIQSHGQDIFDPARDDNGKIIFKLNAVLHNSSSPYLPAQSLVTRMASIKKSCGDQHCSYTGQPSTVLPDLEFQATEGSREISVGHKEDILVGNDGIYDYQRISTGVRSSVHFKPGIYRIQSLDIAWGSTVYLAPGDYWVDHLEVGSGVEFIVEGEGTARILVRNHVNLPWDTRMNWQGQDAGLASALVIYGYKDIVLGSFGRLSGFIYAKGAVELGHASKVRGGVSGAHVLLRSDADVEYAPVDLGNADFGGICDIDSDGVYDGLDPDRDGDGISNAHEEQLGFDPNDNSSTPPDLDGDRIPDALDEDRDGDGVNNGSDAFPDDDSETADLDGDGIGDNADTDRDGDGISNDHETQLGFDPNDNSSTPPDQDGDRTPDALDEDRDGDGVDNDSDVFPDDDSETADLDRDGIGDNADTDRDGDGITNEHETQLGFDPNNASNTPPDLDGDRTPDALDGDIDGDGVPNAGDAFPRDGREWNDLDGDGVGDNSDPDRDGDGISNEHETRLGFDPNDSKSTPPDQDGDRVPDALDEDRDGDGVNNNSDAFPDDASETADLDRDGIGDNADTDRDGDGISNDHETQLGFDPNDDSSTPTDQDGDRIPDALDDDRDGDGVNNDTDAFPDNASETADLDRDGIGDNADTDRDGDGISNDHETQLSFDPNDSNSTPPDLDGDRIPDALDDDRDGDGHANDSDTFPDDAREWADLDNDGVGDNSDPDRDGDGISNIHEQQLGYDPNDATVTPPDQDGDHLPDALDEDRDGDGVNNDTDAFPDDASETADLDGDGIGDNADTDRDGDGISNNHETQLGFDPNDATNTPSDQDGDNLPDVLDDDRDGDGVNNDTDAFPDDASETNDLDGDGIGDNADSDRDGDGISNDHETQLGFNPNDSSSTPPDLDGDQIPDVLDDDRDGDGVNNDTDAFPDDASETADLDSDGIGDNADTDRDGDGISNDHEAQLGFDPNDSSSTPPDQDGDHLPDALDDDRDGDGVNNDADVFPDNAGETSDLDGDGIGDNSDTDRDGDGFSNTEEDTAGTNPDDATDYPDTTPPVITLNGPDSVSTESDLVTLTGLITDEGYGVQKVWATSDRYPATEFAVSLIDDREWTASLPLEIGSNLVTLLGEDKAGNRTEKRITVEREDPDSFVGLTITAPAQNTRVSKDFVIVLGQARSDTPAADVKVTVGGQKATLEATNQVTLFDFTSPKISLTEGVNAIPLVLDVDGELLQRTLIVIYEPEQPVYAEPVISVLSPVSGSQLGEESFLLVADIEAEAGISTVALNGETIIQPDGQPQFFNLREALSFNGGSSLSLSLVVTDVQQQQSEQVITLTRDSGSPSILLDQSLIALPANNLVSEQPYPITGTVVDANLSSFTINGTPVALTPTGDGSGYRFSAALGLSVVSPQPLTLEARDQAGNRTTVEYSLQLSSSITLERILPADGLRLLGGESQSLQVGARLEGVLDGISVVAVLSRAEGEAVSTVELSGESTIRSGNVQVPGSAGTYELLLTVKDGTGQTITSTRSNLYVEAPEVIELAVERMEPAPDSLDSEPNGFISLYFNRPVTPAEVSVEVFETAHGYTYIDNDAPGTDVLQAKGYELVSVTRSHEPVPGELSVLPGNQVLAFYPQRELAYNSEVFVNVTVSSGEGAGQTLLRSRFQTRPLPTFVEGAVMDQFGQEVVGIDVSIPALNRTTTTNRDGGFSFGFGDLPGETLPAGRYELVINQSMKERSFGELKSWVNIDEGARNRLGQLSVPALNRNVAFSPVSGGRELNLLEGAVRLDLTDARLQFPDGRNQGDIHTQFLSFTELPYPVEPMALPMWVYAVQPAGVEVEGEWNLDIAIPQLNNGWEHVPPENTLVLLVGLDKTSRMIVPVGVGRIHNYRVQSEGVLHQTQLDVMGYAIVSPQQQPLLERYVNGEMTLPRLLGEITAARNEEARAYQAQAASNTNNQN